MPELSSWAHQGCGSLPKPSSFVIATVNQRFKTKSEPGRTSLETSLVGKKVEAWGTWWGKGAKFARAWQENREETEEAHGGRSRSHLSGPPGFPSPAPTCYTSRSWGGFLSVPPLRGGG